MAMDDVEIDAEDGTGSTPYIDRFISAGDALRLHVRDYRPAGGEPDVVVCLPGLTRSVRDFHDLAVFLSTARKAPRRVVSVDYRGRGQSGYDPDWRNYNVLRELQDLLAVLIALDIEHADFIGTSRGGLLIMLLAAARPGAIRSAILNDVGPVIDVQGLLRIKRMLADLKPPASWDEAVAATRRFGETAFPGFGDTEWEKMARQTYRDDNGKPAIDFDRTIEKTLDAYDANTEPPSLWPQFMALGAMPTLVIRGGLSGILSDETVGQMLGRHARLVDYRIHDQGHAPTLWDEPTQRRIATFLDGYT